MSKPVCVITGVGPATGSALVRRFATGGYAVAMLARDAERLSELAKSVPDVHVSYIIIDAVIDTPMQRSRMKDRPDDFFIKPAAIADEAFHVAHQDRSAWSFLVEIRPFHEPW